MPSHISHTYGPTCHLSRTIPPPGAADEDDVPAIRAQFFYASPLPIDDPLSAVPAPSGSEPHYVQHTPRPFSAYDNNALEEAWLGLSSAKDQKNHPLLSHVPPKRTNKAQSRRKAVLVSNIAARHNKIHENEEGAGGEHDSLRCCSQLETDIKEMQRTGVAGDFKLRDTKDAVEQLMRDVMAEAQKLRASRGLKSDKTASSGAATDKLTTALPKITGQGDATEDGTILKSQNDPDGDRAGASHQASHDSAERKAKEHKIIGKKPDANKAQKPAKTTEAEPNLQNLSIPGAGDAGTTGTPFQRVSSRPSSPQPRLASPTPSLCREESQECGFQDHSGDYPGGSHGADDDSQSESIHAHRCKIRKNKKDGADVPVGVSRLHLVKLPSLQMMPIYWSPVHDIAAVTRGTWFYRDTLYPVEPAVANQLERGFRELRPWSQTWRDELNCAIEVGAVGEEKISHRLWPKEVDLLVDRKEIPAQSAIATDPYCAARCFHGEVAAAGTVDSVKPDEKTSETAEVIKKYPNSHIIYKDSQYAFILKPSLQPSAYFGRRPLAKIMRGSTIGVGVVRGFNWKAWDKLYPSKKTATAAKAEEAAPVAGNADAGKRSACHACRQLEERQQVTDLVLMIHGIGQKLSERVESFHFTHAINAFRRSVNVELSNDAVQKVLREDLGGIMVLPVNWRSNLSFEDGGPMRESDQAETTSTSFTLKDITPDSIPAVRNLISDVMLDIPFYMNSRHKPKMIEALTTEANRVYRLWCRNNPNFQAEGRVHLIAHSLGSAMALDILSKQPTTVHPDLLSKKIQSRYFDFNTNNLFFVGSPAAFFLLLDKGKLVPRHGRSKPGADHEDDESERLTGRAGEYGCLAADNIYNVMDFTDPIAYRLNATVDPTYASTLKIAHVPSATTGWFETIGSAFRTITPGVSANAELGVGEVAKPMMNRLPSQLEMEVHDFTREEIAEKKLFLLNDNGQIDYCLSSSSGPLEIQYLSMLSAHSSYWTSLDFVRLLVTEVGRKPGKKNTLPNMRARKLAPKRGGKSTD